MSRLSCGSLAGSGMQGQVCDLLSCFQSALDVFKGAPDITPGSSGNLWPGERCLRTAQYMEPHLYPAPLGERSEERGRAPEPSPSSFRGLLPLAPGRVPVQSSHKEASPLLGLSPITAHAKIAVWEPGPAPPTPQHLSG